MPSESDSRRLTKRQPSRWRGSSLPITLPIGALLGSWILATWGIAFAQTPPVQLRSNSANSKSAEVIMSSQLETAAFESLGEGAPTYPLKIESGRNLVFLFVAPDCPISNRYAPEIIRLHEFCDAHQCNLFVVYAEPDAQIQSLRQHATEYGLLPLALWDKSLELATAYGATTVPQAIALHSGPQRRIVYRGRIDDRYLAFGKARIQPQTFDLRDCVVAMQEHSELPFRETRAIGCAIPFPPAIDHAPSK